MMITQNFNEVVEKVIELTLEDKMELVDLLEQFIAEGRREEIAINFKDAESELDKGMMNFSSNIETLKNML